jgi:TatD DNase family protein
MIDSHCHLDHDPLFSNINDIIKRSKKAGITKLLTICTTIKSFERILELIKMDPIIYGTFGIHPHETENNILNKAQIIKKINNKKIIGIGETGLDFFYNHSKKNQQINSFRSHIEAAIDIDLPLIVHSRNAEIETFDILNDYKSFKPKILMHCFTGSEKFAIKLLKLDAFFSASGIITFKNSTVLQKTFSKLPNDKVLVETDSPYLAPIPMRGKQNEPSFVKYTLEKLSILKSLDSSVLSELTTKNFNNLFSLN